MLSIASLPREDCSICPVLSFDGTVCHKLSSGNGRKTIMKIIVTTNYERRNEKIDFHSGVKMSRNATSL